MNLRSTSFLLLCMLASFSGLISCDQEPNRSPKPYSAYACDLGAKPSQSKYWLLELKIELFNDDKDIDVFAYWLMRDHHFRIMQSYFTVKGFYIVEYFPSDEITIAADNGVHTPHEICAIHRETIINGEMKILNNPHVNRFVREPKLVYCIPPSSDPAREVIINPSFESEPTTENWQDILAPVTINYIKSDDEKSLLNAWVDLRNTKRPYDKV